MPIKGFLPKKQIDQLRNSVIISTHVAKNYLTSNNVSISSDNYNLKKLKR